MKNIRKLFKTYSDSFENSRPPIYHQTVVSAVLV